MHLLGNMWAALSMQHSPLKGDVTKTLKYKTERELLLPKCQNSSNVSVLMCSWAFACVCAWVHVYTCTFVWMHGFTVSLKLNQELSVPVWVNNYNMRTKGDISHFCSQHSTAFSIPVSCPKAVATSVLTVFSGNEFSEVSGSMIYTSYNMFWVLWSNMMFSVQLQVYKTTSLLCIEDW